ncbi:hypothetical protein Syun_024643 [Stephania yunnanensis]|uniref:Uncharacterized protein n=1 Tax=Stephania yunnanensis TaxID=152371 RepID=A0AAP0I4R7_9MAGN
MSHAEADHNPLLFRKGGLGMRRSRAEEIRFFRDLELRLGPSWPPKECMFAGNCERRYPDLITINDDGDDNEEDEALELFPIRAAWVPAVTEEDLELRLGSRANKVWISFDQQAAPSDRGGSSS